MEKSHLLPFNYLLIGLVIWNFQPSNAQLCDVLASIPHEEGISSRCLSQLNTICNNGDLLWRMFDASSKYPFSGMTYSNSEDFGNFDQCLAIKHNENEADSILGKYCGLNVAVINPFLTGVPAPFALNSDPKNRSLFSNARVVGKEEFKLYEKDLKADAVNYLVSVLSVCIPDACTPEEAGKYFIWGYLSDLSLVTFVSDNACITKDFSNTFEWGEIVAILFFSCIGLLIVVSTCYDFALERLERKPPNPVLLAFSIKTNGNKLFTIAPQLEGTNQIHIFNGMRFITMMWVVAGHGWGIMQLLPISNYEEVEEFMDNIRIQYIAAAPISVDTFFFMTGFLVTYSFLRAAAKTPVVKQIIGVPMMIIHRYLRLTPALVVLYLAVITFYPKLGSGPLWNTVTSRQKQECRDAWWEFLLYIQNYSRPYQMCLSTTWYLSADMQMFVLVPIVLIPVAYLVNQKKSLHALVLIAVLTFASVGGPIWYNLANPDYRNEYTAHDRFNDYLIGVFLGVLMSQYRSKGFVFNRVQNAIIWTVVLLIDLAFCLYFHDVFRHYTHTKDTLFRMLYRPIWCASLSWMVYSCYFGFGGIVNWILTWPAWQIGAKLSYCMYLLHFTVLLYFYAHFRGNVYWSDYTAFYNWCGHILITTLLSVVWTLAFEAPMIHIERFIFAPRQAKPAPPSKAIPPEAPPAKATQESGG